MTIDLNKYRINAPFIKGLYARDPIKDAPKIISQAASAVHCPCIALAFYLSEELGYTPELAKTIESLIKFYGYDRILGQPDNSPYLYLDLRDIK